MWSIKQMKPSAGQLKIIFLKLSFFYICQPHIDAIQAQRLLARRPDVKKWLSGIREWEWVTKIFISRTISIKICPPIDETIFPRMNNAWNFYLLIRQSCGWKHLQIIEYENCRRGSNSLNCTVHWVYLRPECIRNCVLHESNNRHTYQS